MGERKVRPVIDPVLCSACGVCEEICPHIFKLEAGELAYVINEEEDNSSDLQEAVASCPEGAITLEDVE